MKKVEDLCRKCVHHAPTALFSLCMHESARYSVAGNEDYHTTGHMRTVGACRQDAVLLERVK